MPRLRRSTAGLIALYPTTNWTASSIPLRVGFSFDKAALAEAKRLVNRRPLPQAEDLIETQESFLAAFAWPSLQERGARLRRRAAEVGPDFELRFGHYLVDLGDQ